MFPCINPQVCGVQNHREGTQCIAARSRGKGFSNSPVSRIPEMASSSDAHKLYAKHESLEVNDDSIYTSSFQGGDVDVILTMDPYSDSEDPVPMVFETSLIKDAGMGDAKVNADHMEEFPYAIKQTSEGDLYVEGAYRPGLADNGPVKLDSIKGTETTWSYSDESGATDVPPLIRGLSQINKNPEALAFLKKHAPIQDLTTGQFHTLNEAEEQD